MGACMNGSMYTYEMAPVAVIMEKTFFNFYKSLLKWDKVDGMFTPGGSLANLYGLLLARHNKYPSSKEDGI